MVAAIAWVGLTLVTSLLALAYGISEMRSSAGAVDFARAEQAAGRLKATNGLLIDALKWMHTRDRIRVYTIVCLSVRSLAMFLFVVDLLAIGPSLVLASIGTTSAVVTLALSVGRSRTDRESLIHQARHLEREERRNRRSTDPR